MDPDDSEPSNIARRRVAARADSSPRYRERRGELVRAAATVFAERGFDNTTLRDVADGLGIDRATLYYYVSSKEELFREVVGAAVLDNTEAVEAIRDSDLPPAEKVRAVVSGLMGSYADNYPYLYVWVREDMARVLTGEEDDGADLADLGRRYQVAVESIVREGIGSGDFVDFADPTVVAFGIIGTLNWTHRWYRPGRRTPEDIAEVFSHLLLSGLERR